MSDPGLAHRLRQRSRRAGLMIGISMILTIALCAVAFTMIYASLEGFTNDFVSDPEQSPTAVQQVAQEQNDPAQPEATTAPEPNQQADTQDAAEGDAGAEQPAPTDTPVPDEDDDEEGFSPDYQLRDVTVNLRSGPSTSDSIVTALPPSTPLEYLNEDAPTDSPSDGERWMQFVTEDGLEGWIREIDVTEYQP